MIKKRLWIALLAIPICLASILVTSAERSHPASANGVIDPTCTSSLPCIEYDNHGSGPGVQGVGLAGNGLAGDTKVHSISATNARAGVFGNDRSTSGRFNSGVRGLSVRGTGVSGNSTSGAGVSGTSTNSIGVHGDSPKVGIFGTTSSGFGVQGQANSGFGMVASSASGVGLDATSFGSQPGVNATSLSGFGLVAQTTSGQEGLVALGGVGSASLLRGPGIGAVYGENNDSSRPTALFVQDNAAGPLLQAVNGSTVNFLGLSVDSIGNLQISGQIFTGGSCSHGCVVTKTTSGHEVMTYSTRGPLPSVEDFGQGQLVGGVGRVSINRDFASIMDARSSYLVFITPEGDTQGWLYVSQKSSAGFIVREHGSSHSTVAFDYRIVAKPFASNEARLPIYHPARLALPGLRHGSAASLRAR